MPELSIKFGLLDMQFQQHPRVLFQLVIPIVLALWQEHTWEMPTSGQITNTLPGELVKSIYLD